LHRIESEIKMKIKNFKEVYPGIFRIVEHRSLKVTPPINLYVIAGSDGLLFDGGYGDDVSIQIVGDAIDYIQSINKNWLITRVLLSHTHPDHFAGLRRLQQQYHLKVMLTEPMTHVIANRKSYIHANKEDGVLKKRYSTIQQRLAALPLEFFYQKMFKKLYGIQYVPNPDIIISPHDTITVDNTKWKIIPGPGHCADHIMLYNKEQGILFGGDNILRSIYTWLGPPRSDLQAYMQTLYSCLRLPHLQCILGAHGKPVTNPKQRIEQIIEYRKSRTKQIYSIIANAPNGGITFDRLMNMMYPKKNGHRWLGRGWIIVTIEYLLNKNALMFQDKKIIANPVDINSLL